MRPFYMSLATAACLALPPIAHAEPPATRPEVMSPHRFDETIREALITLPVSVRTPDGVEHRTEFQLTHFRPAGDGPFPVAILHHGRGVERGYPSRARGSRLIGYFVRRGFAVLVPTRVGYGGLGGRIDPEIGKGNCDDLGAQQQIDSVTAHTRATLDFAKQQPWIDGTRVILSGGSVGGYTSVAAAALGIPGIIAVMNFAGGAGGNPKKSPGAPCRPERITNVFSTAGKTLRVPTLWVYAQNDKYWGAKHPRSWHKAFVAAGGKAEFVDLAALEGDGHQVVDGGAHLWRRPADAFLAKLGFKAPTIADAPPRTDYAGINDMTRVPSRQAETTAAYQRFLRMDLPRAFVIAPNGAWASRSGASDALSQALERCAAVAKVPCKPYAVDDTVVWVP